MVAYEQSNQKKAEQKLEEITDELLARVESLMIKKDLLPSLLPFPQTFILPLTMVENYKKIILDEANEYYENPQKYQEEHQDPCSLLIFDQVYNTQGFTSFQSLKNIDKSINLEEIWKEPDKFFSGALVFSMGMTLIDNALEHHYTQLLKYQSKKITSVLVDLLQKVTHEPESYKEALASPLIIEEKEYFMRMIEAVRFISAYKSIVAIFPQKIRDDIEEQIDERLKPDHPYYARVKAVEEQLSVAQNYFKNYGISPFDLPFSFSNN